MTDKTIKQRQQRLRESNKAKGLYKAQVWIPRTRSADLYAYAAKLREEEK